MTLSEDIFSTNVEGFYSIKQDLCCNCAMGNLGGCISCVETAEVSGCAAEGENHRRRGTGTIGGARPQNALKINFCPD